MTDTKAKVTIYTDGGADPNPGPGGWAAILIHEASSTTKELSGGEPNTTNNRMELMAAIRGLEALTKDCYVTLFTDSEYLQKGITEWIDAWVKKGWFRGKKEVKNADLWKRLAELREQHNITFEWVKGHAGNRYNERADALASEQIGIQYQTYKQLHPADVEIILHVACLGNKGGWAALLRHGDSDRIISGRMPDTTSNRVDIIAATEALKLTPDGVTARIYTASDYLRNGATTWLPQWKESHWLTKCDNTVKNRNLWEKLDHLLESRQVDWIPFKNNPPPEIERLSKIAKNEARYANSSGERGIWFPR